MYGSAAAGDGDPAPGPHPVRQPLPERVQDRLELQQSVEEACSSVRHPTARRDPIIALLGTPVASYSCAYRKGNCTAHHVQLIAGRSGAVLLTLALNGAP